MYLSTLDKNSTGSMGLGYGNRKKCMIVFVLFDVAVNFFYTCAQSSSNSTYLSCILLYCKEYPKNLICTAMKSIALTALISTDLKIENTVIL